MLATCLLQVLHDPAYYWNVMQSSTVILVQRYSWSVVGLQLLVAPSVNVRGWSVVLSQLSTWPCSSFFVNLQWEREKKYFWGTLFCLKMNFWSVLLNLKVQIVSNCRDYVFVSQDPKDQLLLGQVHPHANKHQHTRVHTSTGHCTHSLT